MNKTFNKSDEIIPMIVNNFNLVPYPSQAQIYRNYSFLIKKKNFQMPFTQADRQLENQRKKRSLLKQTIKSICDRYFINYFEQDLERIVQKIQLIKKYEGTSKDISETTAAIILAEYWDKIRSVTIRQFCRINGLSTNVFNQKYKIYHKIFGQESKKDKLKESQQHSNDLDSQMPTRLPQTKDENQIISINNPTIAISLIYDVLFKTEYFIVNRRSVIEKFAHKFDELDSRIFKEIDWLKLPIEKIYLIFCAILKNVQSFIKFKDVRNAVQKKFGVIIVRKDCDRVWKIFTKYKYGQEDLNEKFSSQVKKEEEILPMSQAKIEE